MLVCGDSQHLFLEPSIDKHGHYCHYCDITIRGRKRVEREEEGRKGEG
jgi:hypothetical protein